MTDDDQISFVHLTLNARTERFIISCLNGYCKSKRGSKKNIACLESENDICIHLKEVKNNAEFWKDLAREEQEERPFDNENLPVLEEFDYLEENDKEKDVMEPDTASCANFNVDEGMWCFQSESTHSPRTQSDPELSKNVRERNSSWIPLNTTDFDGGCVKGPDLSRDVPEFMCQCGAGWVNDIYPEGKKIFDRTIP